MLRRVIAAGAATLVLPVCATSAHAATVTAKATFTAATDTFKPVNNTSPRGTVTFRQTDNGPITATGTVTGLTANRAYLTVPYSDGVCAPLPGVTAFPSATWTTNANGAATFSVTVNPQAINPLAMFTLDQTHSISIREALVPGQTTGPLTTPSIPNPITEACDTDPVVR
ncbi:superoxide dismutase family protein [Solirubrobacter phytolaccae]|uniref:Superoxide dismutase family protein n=1 Tax=Solirubrobacter phytolaccae TaxID=1404360 RepID=A0A9X3N2N6_9ACTN|nr:hypothetical protein [Solirubrobacter phytolaccae]MDA0178720.1 superoxide dismutase family protein [Solirubrobacter phytolaccae]